MPGHLRVVPEFSLVRLLDGEAGVDRHVQTADVTMSALVPDGHDSAAFSESGTENLEDIIGELRSSKK